VSDTTTQPELNEEIAKLSEKLINAINHQTNLDDSLQQTRHELERARQEIQRLTAHTKEHEKKLADGLLIPKEEFDRRESTLRSEVTAEKNRKVQEITAEKDRKVKEITTERDRKVQEVTAEKTRKVQEITAERDRKVQEITTEKTRKVQEITTEKERQVQIEKDLRLKAEKEKKAMEQELETLTSALFQEANKMVSDARKEKEASDKKVEQLKNQLRDAEILLESQQEQLLDLKGVLEKMASDQEDNESLARSSNAPSSPIAPNNDRLSKVFESVHFPTEGGEEITPDHPLHFSHLIQPVLRTDIQAFEDFTSVLKAAKAASPPPSRVASGSYGSLNAVSNTPSTPITSQPPSPYINNPALRHGNSSPRSSAIGMPPLPLLRETKMFKRTLTEDIEPTLRLDIAPGISWMVRRVVLNSLIDGSLVVEPMPPPPVKFRGPINPCALCGENRVGETYTRRHRFRISEDREKKPFPLCDLCLGRLRSCGDLLSFLRMVSNGHWKADAEDEMKAAWEEFVRLRERMFWHRIAGGVVPVHVHAKDVPAAVPPPLPPRENGTTRPIEGDNEGIRHLEDPFRQYEDDSANHSVEKITDSADADASRQRPEMERQDSSITPAPPGTFS
jgi:GDP/GTP exchange factor Sec2p